MCIYINVQFVLPLYMHTYVYFELCIFLCIPTYVRLSILTIHTFPRKVLPWCIANTALAALIHYYGGDFAEDISSSDKGHMFMSLSVSYLLVTRMKIGLNRYMTQRQGLGDLCRACKELVGYTVTFTRMKHKTDEDKRWRRSVAKRTISVLKTIVAVMKYPSSQKHVWEVDDIGEEDKIASRIAVGDSNERSPLVLALFLRSVIFSHIHKLSTPLEVPQELILMQYTTDLMSAYSDIMKYLTTPYPFPLVQMTRTILFFYIFTLPFALNNDIHKVAPFLFTIFIITYGFVGLELIAMEIDDPFGEDPNDFDVGIMSQTVYSDILLLIRDVDGLESENEIRETISSGLKSVIQSSVENHGQFSRVEQWLRRRGSKNDVLVIDTLAEKVHGITDADDDSDLSEDPDDRDPRLMHVGKGTGTGKPPRRPPSRSPNTPLVSNKSVSARSRKSKQARRTSSMADSMIVQEALQASLHALDEEDSEEEEEIELETFPKQSRQSRLRTSSVADSKIVQEALQKSWHVLDEEGEEEEQQQLETILSEDTSTSPMPWSENGKFILNITRYTYITGQGKIFFYACTNYKIANV